MLAARARYVVGSRCNSSGLIKALRANKNDEQAVVQRALDETRKEIKSKDVDVKAAAVLKLVYVGPRRVVPPSRAAR